MTGDVFTVGHESAYDGLILDDIEVKKLGRRDDYPGGYACRSIDDAVRLIEELGKTGEWAVYRLKADWDRDTEPSSDGWWHDLIHDSVVAEKVSTQLGDAMKNLAKNPVDNLTLVTLTGADDSVKPEELIELSLRFPKVEWGILIGSDQGTNRFPTHNWIRELVNAIHKSQVPVNLSLHICGQFLRDITGYGKLRVIEEIGAEVIWFQRVQLNFHGESHFDHIEVSEKILHAFSWYSHVWDPTIIFQLDGENDDLFVGASKVFRCAGLFDTSHGAGVLPKEWPDSRTDIQCGWAGGIGPDNVVDALQQISRKAIGPFWIDMETKIRSDGDQLFDLKKCEDVLLQLFGGESSKKGS